MGTSIFFSLIFLTAFHLSSSDQNYYKMCMFPNYDTSLCQGIEAGSSKVSCVQVIDSAECSLLLKNGSVDFGLFQPEQAVLTQKLASDFTRVIGEVRHQKYLGERNRFTAVVVVPRNFSGSFKDLRNTNFCHPGFNLPYSFSDRVLKSFERTVIPMPCFKSVSAVEEEIANIDRFFKSACRPGPWAQDYYLDNRLRKNYPNLCKLCDSPSDCQHNTRTMGAFEAVLNCLTKNGGDVAYTSYKKVQEYFGLLPGFAMNADPSQYKLLCPDQTVMDLNSSAPCTWFRQPWPLLIARKDVAGELQPKILNWLKVDPVIPPTDIWLLPLQKLLLSISNRVVNTSTPQKIDFYIDRGVDDVATDGSCRPNIRWCTTSYEEKLKCHILKNAAQTHGMKPNIECIPSISMWSCLKHIANQQVDIISIDTEYSYVARKVFNLSTIVYEDGSRATFYKIIAVKENSDTKIKSAKDLKFKKACFPEYRGLGWVSFVNMLREQKLLKKNGCPEDFLGDSCAPGATDAYHRTTVITNNKLCQLCPTYNNASRDPCAIQHDSSDPTQSSSFYGDLGAMTCLVSSGDIAVVDYMRLLTGERGELDGNIDPNNFRVICKNGSLSGTTGLLVDDDCALSIGIKGEVLGRRDRNGVESRDTSELLINLDKWFGTLGQSSEGVFRMFGKFSSHSDSLFVEGTVSLVHKDDSSFPLVQKFSSLIASSNDDCPSSTSLQLYPSFLLLFTFFFIRAFD